MLEGFECGIGFNHGHGIWIEDDVKVGNNVTIGHYVVLKSGTRIKDNVKIGDYCKTTGLCIIGNNVDIRTGACISKGVIINDHAFIGPGVMTNHTSNVRTRVQKITNIGYGAIIGSLSQIGAGIKIDDNTAVANGSVIEWISNGYNYLGEWRYGYKKIVVGGYKHLRPEYCLEVPEDYVHYMFAEKDLRMYLPKWEGFDD